MVARFFLSLAVLLLAGIVRAQAPLGQAAPYHAPRWTPWHATGTPASAPPAEASPPHKPPPEDPPIIRVWAVTSEDVARPREFSLTRLPGPERVFRLDSDADLRERIRQDALSAGRRPPIFPPEPSLPPAPPATAPPAPSRVFVEPAYVCHERLMFEEINSERYGWDLGGVQALVLTADFYLKVVTAPLRRLFDPCRRYDCDLGLCLPGDPVPYVLRISSR